MDNKHSETSAAGRAAPLYLDPDAAIDQRVDDLVGRMTLEERTQQMQYNAPSIPRLGVPEYNWWNECLHGVARAGVATVFPQAIGLAAMWNEPLLFRIATAISDEARAKHHEAVRLGNRGIYQGLTFWSPNINIFRDPRWGRGQETFGEDPFLTSRLGVAFVKGLQGDDPRYLKLVATPKHFAVHSGPDGIRHSFNALTSARDLWDTYLPAFEACICEGKAASIMGAYNRMNGELCCASPTLLQKILRDRWGFDGCVVSDCGAIRNFHADHKITTRPEESTALAVKNGCDLCCGLTYGSAPQAIKEGLLSEADVDVCVKRVMKTLFRLGVFDPPERVPYTRISPKVNNCATHRRLALQSARESMVLLKNEGNLLPLKKNIKSLLITGPNAYSLDVLLANYNGYSPRLVSPLEGILAKVSPGTALNYARGCELGGGVPGDFNGVTSQAGDVIIAVMGLSPALEHEMGDRAGLGLPAVQEAFLKALHATGKPVVLVLTGGSPVSFPWAKENIPAILWVGYPGEEGGTAIGDILFGDYNPAGRLPVTYVKAEEQLPPFDDYSMRGRTYRYMEQEPLYPFGYGLSYTRFEYSDLKLSAKSIKPSGSLRVTATVRNVGGVAGDEVVQLYIKDLQASVTVPIRHLAGFRRIHLAPGGAKRVTFTLTPQQLSLVGEDGNRFVEPGEFDVYVGGGQPGTEKMTGSNTLKEVFTVRMARRT